MVVGACACEPSPLVLWCPTHVSVYSSVEEDSARYGYTHGMYTHGGSRGLCGSVCTVTVCAVLNCLHRYIARQSSLEIVCSMSRVQQGGSQAVKTDSGLLPKFHLHIQFSDFAIFIKYKFYNTHKNSRRRLSAAVRFSSFHCVY